MKKAMCIASFVTFMVLADQATKLLAEAKVEPYSAIEVLPFFDLVNVRNEGSAFGLFGGLGNWFFIAVSVLAIGFVVVFLFKGRDSTLGLSLLLSGAIGNLIDRLYLGYVRDFIDVFIGRYHWPAFNIADSCLTVGVLLLLLPLIRPKAC